MTAYEKIANIRNYTDLAKELVRYEPNSPMVYGLCQMSIATSLMRIANALEALSPDSPEEAFEDTSVADAHND